MTSFDRIIALLKSTKIYSYKDKSLVLAEMRAYAIILEELMQNAKIMREDCFFFIEGGKYCNGFEEMYGFPQSLRINDNFLQNNKEKIELIKKRISITNRDSTKQGVEKCLNSLGFEVELSENIPQKIATVRVLSNKGYFGYNSVDIKAIITKYLPYNSTANIILFE